MRKARNIKVGDVVQFPAYEFAPFRSGWNGWIFRAAIVDRLYTSKSGKPCAEITYCSRVAGRYQLLPNTEAKTRVLRDNLFQYDVPLRERKYREMREYEKNGEKVCWDEDTALLLNHGIIKEF